MNSTNANNRPNHVNNPDPITGAPGSHPVGTTLGAAGVGAAAGAVGAAVAGPVGAVVGAVTGAVVGGLSGKAVAEAIDPTVETKYWSESYTTKSYADPKIGYQEYAPAYRYGWESYTTRGGSGKTFENVENELQNGWERARGESQLSWDKAKSASRDAWNRVKDAGAALAGHNPR